MINEKGNIITTKYINNAGMSWKKTLRYNTYDNKKSKIKNTPFKDPNNKEFEAMALILFLSFPIKYVFAIPIPKSPMRSNKVGIRNISSYIPRPVGPSILAIIIEVGIPIKKSKIFAINVIETFFIKLIISPTNLE